MVDMYSIELFNHVAGDYRRRKLPLLRVDVRLNIGYNDR